jgi:5-methylcytosine-specific restriction endonuclease McrA
MYESRKAAKTAGRKFYVTGKPCKRNHVATRYTSTGQCVACMEEWAPRYRADRPDVAAAAKARYRSGHPDRVKASSRLNYDRNAERYRSSTRNRYAANPALYRAQQAARRRENPAHAAAILARSYLANRPQRLAAAKAWRDANKPAVSARNAAWRKANPLSNRVKAARYRARQAAASGSYTSADVEIAIARQDGECVYCGRIIIEAYHVDHVIPLIAGGSNAASNIQVTCETCNCQKGRKTHEQYLAFRSKHRMD